MSSLHLQNSQNYDPEVFLSAGAFGGIRSLKNIPLDDWGTKAQTNAIRLISSSEIGGLLSPNSGLLQSLSLRGRIANCVCATAIPNSTEGSRLHGIGNFYGFRFSMLNLKFP
jgi:hypothetical protein